MMTFRFVIVFLLLAVSSAISDKTYADHNKCNPDGNTMEMSVCAKEDFKKADAELNKVYKTLLQKEKSDAAFIKKLRKSQNAWIKFRDAELLATFACEKSAMVCQDSMYPVCYNKYKAKITRDRIARLKKYLTDGRPADDCRAPLTTPLHDAALRGDINFVKHYIETDKSLNPATKYGSSPLHNAANNGHLTPVVNSGHQTIHAAFLS